MMEVEQTESEKIQLWFDGNKLSLNVTDQMCLMTTQGRILCFSLLLNKNGNKKKINMKVKI